MTLQEAQIQALIIKAKAIETEVIGMRLHDEWAIRNNAGVYLEALYIDHTGRLLSISNEIKDIAGRMAK